MSDPLTLDFDFDAFIDGASVTEESVEIFQNGEVLGKYEDWRRRYERAAQLEEADGERSANEEDPLAVLIEEGAVLLTELEESRTVWFVRALEPDAEIAIEAAHPAPENPFQPFTDPQPQLPSHPTEKQATAYVIAMEAWTEKQTAHLTEQYRAEPYKAYSKAARQIVADREAEKVHRGFVRIEKDSEVIATKSPSVEQVKALRAKIGELQFGRLVTAIDEAKKKEPEVAGAFLSLTSQSARG